MQSCPEDDEDNIALSSEEKQSLLNAKQTQIRHLVGKCELFCFTTFYSYLVLKHTSSHGMFDSYTVD